MTSIEFISSAISEYLSFEYLDRSMKKNYIKTIRL